MIKVLELGPRFRGDERMINVQSQRAAGGFPPSTTISVPVMKRASSEAERTRRWRCRGRHP